MKAVDRNGYCDDNIENCERDNESLYVSTEPEHLPTEGTFAASVQSTS